jgi:hypothetical protein
MIPAVAPAALDRQAARSLPTESYAELVTAEPFFLLHRRCAGDVGKFMNQGADVCIIQKPCTL